MATNRFRTSRALLAAALLGANGCTYGFLYSDTVVPLDRNMNRTPVSAQSGASSTKQVNDSFVTGVRVLWASRAIGDAAHEGRLSESQYADLHVVRILGGLYEQSTVIVYGK